MAAPLKLIYPAILAGHYCLKHAIIACPIGCRLFNMLLRQFIKLYGVVVEQVFVQDGAVIYDMYQKIPSWLSFALMTSFSIQVLHHESGVTLQNGRRKWL